VRGSGLQLADLVDVELQLLRDRDASREDVRRRDRRIGIAIDAGAHLSSSDPDARLAVLRGWVRAVHAEAGHESAGARMVRAYHALGWLLTLFGLSSGTGAAAAVLSYDGTRPVNVVHFLVLFVAVQAILVLLLALSSTLWRFRDRIPAVSGLYGLLRWAFDAMGGLFERRLSAERRAALKAARGRLRSSTIVYGNVERWLLVSLAQRFGLAFNLGALATCLYLVAFSDLAFAWQTTLSFDAEDFHRVLSVLAAPWSWAYPEGLPTLEVVRASRYFRLDSSFGQAAPAELLGQWWRFLVLCLLVYGLAPRLILSLVARAKLRRALAALRLDHGEIASLLERLASPLVQTHAPAPEAGPDAAPAPGAGPAVAAARPSSVATVVVWGDVPIDRAQVDTLIAGRFGWRVGSMSLAGAGEARHDAAAIQAVAAGQDGQHAPVVLLAEAFEAPTREARTFLGRLRAEIGADRPIVVSLVDSDGPDRWSQPSADDVLVWQKHLAQLGDPYLRVEALVESA
jgi:hypothetical protein